MAAMIKAIPTMYRGYLMRSRLEVRWAAFFDSLGIRWRYEDEGYVLSDGTWYLPDFYFPESHSWGEVKGVMDDIDLHKIKQLIQDTGRPVTVFHPDMQFQACNNWGDSYELLPRPDSSSVLVRCLECGKYYFMGTDGAYTCPCCGAYDGDHHFTTIMEGDADTALDNLTIKYIQTGPGEFDFDVNVGYKDAHYTGARAAYHRQIDHRSIAS